MMLIGAGCVLVGWLLSARRRRPLPSGFVPSIGTCHTCGRADQALMSVHGAPAVCGRCYGGGGGR